MDRVPARRRPVAGAGVTPLQLAKFVELPLVATIAYLAFTQASSP
jgi:hypothetical protein